MMIYLDNNATTRVDPEVINSMLPFFESEYGNPSNYLTQHGSDISKRIDKCRSILVEYFSAQSIYDFIFTSGATESNNMVIRGIVEGNLNKPIHIVVSSIEHKSILSLCRFLSNHNHNVSCTYLPVDTDGHISIKQLIESIRDDTILVSIMGANNEIGTINPIEEISEICHSKNILFHSDITQLVANQRLNLVKASPDLLTFSAHKIHGPKGVGCLYANTNARKMLHPLFWGGNQQNGMRSGTLNVPGIVGLTKAVELLDKRIDTDIRHITKLRNILLENLEKLRVVVNGDLNKRLANNLNIILPNTTSLFLHSYMPEVVFSSSSACITGEESYVLKAIGRTKIQRDCSVRFGLSRFTTENEIDYVSNQIIDATFYRKTIIDNN
ncbi:MAG: cysteine desulfurase family protein [Floccifex sp.]